MFLQRHAEDIDALPDVLVGGVSLLPELIKKSRATTTSETYKRGFKRWCDWALSNKLSSKDTLPAKAFPAALYISSKYDWDDPPSTEMKMKVNKWVKSLPDLNNVKLERSLNFSDQTKDTTLHVFVDASEVAYCAVIYARHEMKDETINVHFVTAKSRVEPLKSTSIPRLELMAAIIGLRLVLIVTEVLKVAMKKVLFWFDSSTVLWWIHNKSKAFKPFVGNRIAEIQTSTTPNQWRYVPTQENPADIGSRGAVAHELVDNEKWWSKRVGH